MKGKMYILMAIVIVLLCVAGCDKNNEKQKSPSGSKEKKVKSVQVSVEDIKAMYKDWIIEEQKNGIGFNTRGALVLVNDPLYTDEEDRKRHV